MTQEKRGKHTTRVGLAALGVVAAIGAVWWLSSSQNRVPSDVAASSAVSVAPSSGGAQHDPITTPVAAMAPATQREASLPKNPVAASNTTSDPSAIVSPANPAAVEDLGKVKDRYASCQVLDERTGPADKAGRYERVRVVKTDMKYPLVRVVERFQGSGGRSQESDTLLFQSAMVADHVTVQVKAGTTQAELAAFAAEQGGTILRQLRVPGPGAYLVRFGNPTVDTVPRALATLAQAGGPVASVHPDGVAYATETVPNDARFGELWGMKNTGQTLSTAPRDPKTGTPGADIKATEAWDQTTGSSNVLVAVIDTGIDYTHEDLAANMWSNPGETGTDAGGKDKCSNGIDDDGNGFVDDWHGWNFCADNNDPMDDYAPIYHGTHCAGTIGAVGNNGIGVAGVCWNVSLVGIKFLNAGGSGTWSDGIEAIYYATGIGAKLTSNSYGGMGGPEYKSDPTDLMRAAINDAGAHGIPFVAAAGNNNSDNDGEYIGYPASYDCDNIIAVAATDAADNLASFSCYGHTTVDLGAPGVNILSCKADNQYQYLAGTSMATPHVAGAAAQMASLAPGWTPAQIKARLLEETDPLPALAGKCVSGGRLNMGRASLSARPLLRWRQTQLADAGGNDDGLANPGETVQLTVTLQNLSPNTSTGVSATLTCADPEITLVDTNAAFGDFAALQEKAALDTFAIAISPACSTPHEVTLNLSIADAGTGTWTNTFKVMVYTSYPIAGTVTLDGAPAAGVTLEYQGPLAGSRVTDAAGRYRFGTLAGVSTLTAKKDGWLASLPVNVTLPPTRTNVNFAFTTATVSGCVTNELTGAAMSGAIVAYGEGVTGSVSTDGDGRYTFTRIYGRPATLTLTAQYPGYFDEPHTVTVPPDATVDFAMGYSDIEATPTAFAVSGTMGEVLTRTLTLANHGSRELTYAINPPGKVLRHFAPPSVFLPADCNGLADDGTALWMLNFWQLARHDPLTGATLGHVDVPQGNTGTYLCEGLDSDGANLWMMTYTSKGADPDNTYIHAVNPQTGQIGLTFTGLPTNCTRMNALALDSGCLWVKGCLNDTPTTKRVWKLDAAGTVLNSWVLPPDVHPGYGLEYVGGAVWMGGGVPRTSDSSWATVNKLDPATGQLLESFRLPSDGQINELAKAGSRALWVRLHTSSWDDYTRNGEAYLVDLGDEPWMHEAPRTGAVSRLATRTVTLTFDTVAAGVGVHESYYRIVSNDPDEPELELPVTFTVLPNPANHAPVIAEGASTNVTMSEDGTPTPFSLTLHATDADDDALAWSLASGASHGTAVAYGRGASLPVVYTPAANYAGTDRFVIQVADGRGATATIAVNVTIQGFNKAPTVTATATPVSGTVPLTVAFTGAGADPDGDALTYLWDFGTGDGSNVASPSYVFTNPGTYAVTVTVRDPAGLTATAPPLTITAWPFEPVTNQVYAWGWNDSGQLGDGSTTSQSLPVPASGLGGAIAIAAHHYGTAAIRYDGTFYGWGYNGYGRLGDGTTANQLTPVQAPGFAGATALAMGNVHTVVCKRDGSVWACGYNYFGQLGDGTTSNRLTPVVAKLADGTPLSGVIGVAAGDHYTLALKADGSVLAWGYNYKGQLGDGTTTDRRNPVGVKFASGMPLSNIVAIAAGSMHSLALQSDGRLWVWGYNNVGQLGDNTTTSRSTPVLVPGLAGVSAIAAGYSHTLAVKTDGSVWAWGLNDKGQLGDGSISDRRVPVRVQQTGGTALENVRTVAAGYSHSLAIKADSTAWAWGENNWGQLGDGTLEKRVVAVPITALANVVGIAADTHHTAAIVGGSARIVADLATVSVAEGGTATVRVKLSQAPAATTLVSVARTSGDLSLTVSNGASLTFTPDNWNVYQPVTLAAAEDNSDAANGTATFACTATNRGTASVTAAEVDNDVWLYVYATPDGSAAPNGLRVVSKVTAIPIVATPDAGCTFLNWTVLSGPATFANANAATTTVTLANDALTQSPYNQVRATFTSNANRPPTIVAAARASPNPTTLADGATVFVVASEPDNDPLAYAWSTLSGPGTATFATPEAAHSDVAFSAPGTYVLRVTVSDGRDGSATSDVTIEIGETGGSRPQLTGVQVVENGWFAISWLGETSKVYTVQMASNLVTGFTLDLQTGIRGVAPVLNVYTDMTGTAHCRFYRLMME